MRFLHNCEFLLFEIKQLMRNLAINNNNNNNNNIYSTEENTYVVLCSFCDRKLFKRSGKRCIQRIAILFTMVMDTLISTLYNKNKNEIGTD